MLTSSSLYGGGAAAAGAAATAAARASSNVPVAPPCVNVPLMASALAFAVEDREPRAGGQLEMHLRAVDADGRQREAHRALLRHVDGGLVAGGVGREHDGNAQLESRDAERSLPAAREGGLGGGGRPGGGEADECDHGNEPA